MSEDTFFDESKEQSIVKSTIVSKYFDAWAQVVIPSAKKRSGKIAYIDLFAGPGRYKDRTKSTPLLVLERAIAHADMRQMLVTLFNDKDPEISSKLAEEISNLSGIEKLKNQPKVYTEEVGERIVEMFGTMTLVPTLFFVDPWGYKGLSLGLVNSVLKDWGCDCVFFFNYNRINMGLGNPAVKEHMDALFGSERGNQLRNELEGLTPNERELLIVEELMQALKGMEGNYVLPFTFRNDKGNRTSHHLFFVSKHFKGYEIMKEIMAKESTTDVQGVPSLEYNPASKKFLMLFELDRPLDDLQDLLLKEFASTEISVRQLYERHSVDRKYIKKNYKDVLKTMEAEGKIIANPSVEERKKDTMADRVIISFPSREE